MSKFTLYRGPANYSSWSMRGWLALEQAGPDFDVVAFHLGEPGVRERIRPHSPTAKVPSLQHGELLIWDSLAIAEYLAEQFPAAGLWPVDTAARAVARAVVAEMHSGFPALRTNMPFNVRRSSPGKGRAPGVGEDIARILELWEDCRSRFGDGGPFLFGSWSLADVFYAPVVSRFRTYEVALDSATSRDYASAVWKHPHVREWRALAEAESWVEPQYDL